MIKLSQVDDLFRPDHSYISTGDKCYFIRSFKPQTGYQGGETNDLILNFKKELDRKNRPEWYYKKLAIEQIAKEFSNTIPLEWLQPTTLIPIPPSKCKENPLYDDRMLKVLSRISELTNINYDIRELILNISDMDPSHRSGRRAHPDEIKANYKIDPNLTQPHPKQISLFDDVLTAGAHFRACKEFLSSFFPNVPVIGIFIARVERTKTSIF